MTAATPQTKPASIGLALIIADETTTLHPLFKSIAGVFDEVVVNWNGTNPETRTILESYGARVLQFPWEDHFAKARNISYNQSTCDFICYLDADDTLENPDQFRTTVARAFSDSDVNVLELPYYYDFDSAGNCVMLHWVARVIRKGTFNWVGAIHECLLPAQDFKKCRAENVYVKHSVDPERVARSAERNLRISKREYEREHRDSCVDPRTTLQYAKSLNAKGHIIEAVDVFEEYLEQSDWDDEKYSVLCMLADIHTRSRQYTRATDYARRALTLRPLFGQAYFELAEINYRLEKWDDTIHLLNVGFNSRCPSDIIPVDPSEYRLRPLIILDMALFQVGRPQEALAAIDEALKLQPKNPHLLARRQLVLEFIARMELEKSAIQLLKWIEKRDDKTKIRALINALPDVLQDHPSFIRVKNGFNALSGAKNRLVIYCGPTYETWSPDTARLRGIGGSEEAVIYLSRELLRLGWSVTVYNNCDRPGIYDGIEYRNFWEHDPAVPADIFIAWRNSEYLMLANAGSRAFMWLHDRQKPEYWKPERISKAERIFVLSNYHRKDLPEIPDEKFFVTANGINPFQFAGVSQISRDPLKCFYASSPDRGLDILLALWPEIRAAVPEATLHVFYGFSHTYDMLHRDHANMQEFKERILNSLKQPGVHYHGKVSHAELHDHMMSSGLWLYPTYFTEISCITAMKAQVAGAIPITMTLAALDETVQHGYKISFGIQDERSQKAFVNVTIDLLQNPAKQDRIRTLMMPWALDHFSWEKVARAWDAVFRKEDTSDQQPRFDSANTVEIETTPLSS